MVAFIGNTLRGKVSGENFDELIASRQNLSDFSPVKILRCTVLKLLNNIALVLVILLKLFIQFSLI